LSAGALKLNFKKSGSDSITVSGTLPVAAGTSFAGVTCTVSFGGVVSGVLTLNAKGLSPKGSDSFSISKPKNGEAKFTAKLSGAFVADLSGLFADAAEKKESATVPITVLFDSTVYSTLANEIYMAKANVAGSAKLAKP
jgi:hypothetical protein